METHLNKIRINHFKTAATLDGKRRSSAWDLCLNPGDASKSFAFMDMLTRTFGASLSLASQSTSGSSSSQSAFFDLRSSAHESPPPTCCTLQDHASTSTLYPHHSVTHPCARHPTFTVIKTPFSITSKKKDIPYPHANQTAQDKKARKEYTDKQHLLADKGYKFDNAMEFIRLVRTVICSETSNLELTYNMFAYSDCRCIQQEWREA